MRACLINFFLVFLMVALSGAEAFCQEVDKEELLPPPRVESRTLPFIQAPPPMVIYPPSPPPVGPRDVWQLYDVDSSGRFRPRVIYSPAGSYYLYNRQPFPWTTTRPLSHRFIVN